MRSVCVVWKLKRETYWRCCKIIIKIEVKPWLEQSGCGFYYAQNQETNYG